METQQSDAIQHHGIKNQKWGVKNGPPYPLERPCSVDRNAGETIPAGTTIYRVTNDPFNDINNDYMYATYKESDRNYYKAGWDVSKGTRLRYESSYTTNVDLKIPSVNERIAISKKVFDENTDLVVEAYNAYALHKDWRYSDALLLSKSMAKLSKAKNDSAISKVDLSELESKAGPVDLNTRKNMRAQYNWYQDVVTQAPDDIKTQFSALGMSYSDELKGKFADEHLKRGYNCMFDDHGTHTGGKDGKTTIRMTDSPIIVIDPSKTLKAGPSTMITDKDRQRANKQYLKWQDGTKVKIDNCPLSIGDVSREDGSLSHSDKDAHEDYFFPVLQDPEHPLTLKDLFEYFKFQNENSDTIEHRGVKGMKWKNHVYKAEQEAQKVVAGLDGMTVATANKALKKLALKKIKAKKSKQTRKRSSSKQKKALKKIVSKRKKSKVTKGSGTVKALTDGPTKAKKRATPVTPYKSKFKLTSAMKRRAKYLGFRHSDYINSLVQVDDLSQTLEHHGVKDQKWGVRNGPPYPLERPCSVDRNAGETIPAGTTIYRVTTDPKNDVNNDFMYATYKESDRNYYKGEWDPSASEKDTYEAVYKTTSELKMPSANERIDIYSNIYDKNKELIAFCQAAQEAHEWLGSYDAAIADAQEDYEAYKNSKQTPQDVSDKFWNEGADLTVYEEKLLEGAPRFKSSKAMEVAIGLSYSNELKSKVAKECEKRGYNCVLDDASTLSLGIPGTRGADTPIIIFNPKKSVSYDSETKLNSENRREAANAYDEWNKRTANGNSASENWMISIQDVENEDTESLDVQHSAKQRRIYTRRGRGVIKDFTPTYSRSEGISRMQCWSKIRQFILRKYGSRDQRSLQNGLLIQKESLKNAITHSGVKGQRWGVRNGPPYPLERPCSVDRNAGETIPAGTTIYSVSINGSNASDKYMNASYKKEDRLRNRAAAFKNDLDDGVDFDAVEKKYVITEDLKVPSVNERIKMGSKVFDNNKELMAMTFIASDTADGMGDVTYSDSAKDAKIVYQRAKELLSKGDTISDQPDGIYVSIFKDATNHIESIKSDNDKALMVSRACQFYDEAKDAYAKEHIKRGYNCMVDDYACHELDVKGVSRRSADTPLILINPNSTCTLDARNKLTLDQLVEDHATWMNSVDSADSTNGNRMLSMYDIKRLENDSHASTNMRHSYNGQDEGVIKTNTLIQKESLKNAITHSGVKGQRWGVKNGPPYPLGANAKAAYKKVRKAVETGIKASRKAAKTMGKVHKAAVLGPKDSEGMPLNWRHLSNRQLRTMSSKEIQVAKNRLKLENEYREAYSKTPEAQKAKARKEAIGKVKKTAINTSKKLLVTGGTALAREVFDGDPIMTAAINALAGKPKQDNNNNNNNKKKDKNNNNNNNKTASSGVKKYITSKLKGPKQREKERNEKDAARTKAIAKILAEEYQKSPTVSKYVGPNGNAAISQTNKGKKYKMPSKKEKT